MHSPEDAKELYDELAERIRAQDDAGARRVFHELRKTGRSRQEIVAEISRLIEERSADQPLGKSTEEIPWLRHPKPSIWSHTPVNGPQHQYDIPAAKTAGEPEIPRTDSDTGQRARAPNEPRSSAVSAAPEQPLTNQKAVAQTGNANRSLERRQGVLFENIVPQQIGTDLSVAERAASKLKLQAVLSAGNPEPSAPADAVAAKDQPRPVQRASRASARRIGIFLTGTSIIATVSAGLFVLWSFYGSEVQDFLSARAPSVLTWLQEIGDGNNVSFGPDADKPRQRPGPQPGAVEESNQTPKEAEARAAQPATDRSIRNPEAAVTEPPVANGRGARTEPNTATSTPSSAPIAEEPSSQRAAPTSQVAEPVPVPTATPSRSQQNEPDGAQARQTVAPQVPAIDTGALIAQGDQLLARFDVASARLFYQHAAEARDGRGALRMGMTFDRVFLARWRLRGVRADRAQAIAWYRHASALGNADADLLLTSLNRRTEAASRFIPAPVGQIAEPRGKRTRHGPRRATATQ